MKMLQLFFCLISLLIVSACNKKTNKTKKLESKVLKKEKLLSSDQVFKAQELLALHHEIPDTLLGFNVVDLQEDLLDKQAIEVVYKPIKNKSVSQQDIKKSYLADMEMLGWKMIGEFEHENIQLIFQKAGAKLLSTVMIQHDLCIKVTVCAKK